jgi:hypothetical protein
MGGAHANPEGVPGLEGCLLTAYRRASSRAHYGNGGGGGGPVVSLMTPTVSWG